MIVLPLYFLREQSKSFSAQNKNKKGHVSKQARLTQTLFDLFWPFLWPYLAKMVRKLKHHEQKLLKKVDFINWEVDNNLHEVKVMKR